MLFTLGARGVLCLQLKPRPVEIPYKESRRRQGRGTGADEFLYCFAVGIVSAVEVLPHDVSLTCEWKEWHWGEQN